MKKLQSKEAIALRSVRKAKTMTELYNAYGKMRKAKGLSYRSKKMSFNDFSNYVRVEKAFSFVLMDTKSAQFNLKVIKERIEKELYQENYKFNMYKMYKDTVAFKLGQKNISFKAFKDALKNKEIDQFIGNRATNLNNNLKEDGVNSSYDRAALIGMAIYGSD